MTAELERRMRRFLEAHSHHFQLALVLVSRLGWREEAEAWAEQYCREKSIEFHRLDGSRMDPCAFIRHIIAHQGQTGLFLLTGLDGALSHRETRLADLLNRQRERIGRSLKGPVLWIIGETAFDRLLQDAPDLADWRSAMFIWEGAAAPAVADSRPRLTSALSGAPVSPGSLRRRAALLRAQMDRAKSAEERGSIALDLTRVLRDLGDTREALAIVGAALALSEPHKHLQAKLFEADLLGGTGQSEKAEGAVRQALALAREQTNPRAQAVALGILADVLQTRGELDEALRIRRDEELPVYEKLDDQRARADTLGEIADLLRAQGQLEEALSIYRDEVLPLYEEMRDSRARAITQREIADVLQARGEFGKALSTYHNLLPVFEEVRDVREYAVTLEKIADAYFAWGNPDSALSYYRDARDAFEVAGEQARRIAVDGKIDHADVVRRME